VLHQLGLTVAKQPKAGAGGLVNFTVGRDAQVIHSSPETATSDSSMFDVTQAYGQYATGPLTFMAGKFVTLHGTEVIASTGNNNFSRSILFGAVPFTHTGLRAVYAISDTLSVTAGVNNGWDQLQDLNKGKTAEVGISMTPIKPLTIAASGYFGKEPAAGGDGQKKSVNVVASWAFTDALSIGGEYLRVEQEKFMNAGGEIVTAKYDGFAGYVTFMLSPQYRIALRGETFKDNDGLKFGTGNAGTKYKEATATFAYLPSASFELRAEGRRDSASNTVFADTGGGGLSKTLTTFAFQALYKF
jgi:hypothetical protein